MTNEHLTAVLERVRNWPQKRQEDAARALLEMEAQDASPYRLTDDQLAEVRRRRAKKNPRYISLDEARSRFRQPPE